MQCRSTKASNTDLTTEVITHYKDTLTMDDFTTSLPLPLILLYAETHFRFFPFFPSLTFRRDPEVVFDVPRRIEPGSDLPILLLINDIDRYPSELIEVEFALSEPERDIRVIRPPQPRSSLLKHPLSFQSHAFLFWIKRSELGNGQLLINAKAVIRRGKKTLTVLNDNLFGTSRAPYRCVPADTSLPGKHWCSYGDLHTHSQFSQSHVEFGPPISAISSLAASYGLDFVGVTDHSYDLACTLRDYLVHSNGEQRWEAYQEEVEKGKQFKTLVIPSEEISCKDGRGRTVHLCGYGLRNYLQGSHDGARRNAKKTKQLTIDEALDSIHDQGGIGCAAHPGNRFGRLQQLLLGRGGWTDQDIGAKVDGIQAVNSRFGPAWERAKRLWIKKLQAGQRLPIVAGSDAHGDFNRYRALTTPFVRVSEWEEKYLGHVRTGIYGRQESVDQLLQGLREGRTFVTSGPYLCLSSSESVGECVISKTDFDLRSSDIVVIASTSYEFGSIRRLRIMGSDYTIGAERVIWAKMYEGNGSLEAAERIDLTDLPAAGYLRAEALCVREDGEITQAYTSGCFFRNE